MVNNNKDKNFFVQRNSLFITLRFFFQDQLYQILQEDNDKISQMTLGKLLQFFLS